MRFDCAFRRAVLVSIAAVGCAAVLAAPASAHCDGMDGPVVKAAQEALAKDDVNLVLIWVRKHDEAEVKRAFDRSVKVRKFGSQAEELADKYFFETLVRIHRAGEGVPFTGLKPAGRDLGPAIPAADQALKSGEIAPLTDLLVEQMRTGLLERYKQAMTGRDFKSQDIDAGREYVDRYVTFIHYVEGMYEAASHPVEGHHPHGTGGLHQEN